MTCWKGFLSVVVRFDMSISFMMCSGVLEGTGDGKGFDLTWWTVSASAVLLVDIARQFFSGWRTSGPLRSVENFELRTRISCGGKDG